LIPNFLLVSWRPGAFDFAANHQADKLLLSTYKHFVAVANPGGTPSGLAVITTRKVVQVELALKRGEFGLRKESELRENISKKT